MRVLRLKKLNAKIIFDPHKSLKANKKVLSTTRRAQRAYWVSFGPFKIDRAATYNDFIELRRLKHRLYDYRWLVLSREKQRCEIV